MKFSCLHEREMFLHGDQIKDALQAIDRACMDVGSYVEVHDSQSDFHGCVGRVLWHQQFDFVRLVVDSRCLPRKGGNPCYVISIRRSSLRPRRATTVGADAQELFAPWFEGYAHGRITSGPMK